VPNGLLHYRLNLGKWIEYFNVACDPKRLFAPELNILLKLLEVRAQLIMQVHYFSNIYKVFININ
jgi:hypothetical protein